MPSVYRLFVVLFYCPNPITMIQPSPDPSPPLYVPGTFSMHRLSVIYPISIGLGCRSGHFANHSETCWALTFTAHAGDCTRLEASRSHFGHANEGAAQTHKLWKRPKAVDLSSRFYADPCAILDDLGATHPRPFLDTEERGENLERLKHVFNRLSPELKFEIFSYQSFDELLNIRLRIRQLLGSIAALVELEAVLRNGPYSQPFDCESDEKLMEIAGSFFDQLASIGADSPLREDAVCFTIGRNQCHRVSSISE
ncbi:uncharacterized protein EURHEDRAFT_404152 [Aspergillus ruber CBS 135680]|uniref:Uncharacterized protein n=1 Tax=Aspergillus ruber (strain CBS 135680) TaxID=1388766 RepID=A0A017SAT2_ASPRC|nr:uncharacterized protein EURHEDRAFT_404152 [Aspergillus ruber CBS 135680]EYE93744.1 hypothetical protein EURHEDRAFT_404152 [Aspergillus ruber CBS 135680]